MGMCVGQARQDILSATVDALGVRMLHEQLMFAGREHATPVVKDQDVELADSRVRRCIAGYVV